MKKMFFGMLVFSFSLAAFGANGVEKKGLLVSVDLHLKDAKKALQMRNKIILPKENNEWTPLAPAKNGVALLGKFEAIEKGVLTARFMIVDTSTTPVVVNQMGVATGIGKSSEINSKLENGDGVSVGVLVEETNYEEK